MRHFKLISVLMCVLLLMTARIPTAFADWASKFVVYVGGMYTVTEAEVTEDRIGERIGKVTRYSDREGTYRGNFSNAFPKGTPYYAIIGESASETIAVRTPEGRYWAAVYSGDYPEAAIWASVYFWIGVVVFVVGVMIMAVWLTNPKQKRGF
ncbi:hypothetical protein RB620_04845 [Paenibacillus sp. LHD-117]|uniref:hypothetical protein n=1 Tax=Paenibacillus sp. LHD-117 TaxID=3071412 RepID=UPI0027DF7113|nr:hypothetical protein [Paenibacillus sp. LHD-117]MDQ6418762.1 hypothetical protein [Paenibacillus sp. LHD-117]